MNRIYIFLCLAFMLSLISGCGGKQEKKSMPNKASCLNTSIDVAETFRGEKLSKIGISSELGEKIAAAEGEQAAQSPSTPVVTESIEEKKDEKKPEVKAEKTNDPAPPMPAPEVDEPSIEFNFEDADLETLINQIADLFDITFITDDAISPMSQNPLVKSVKKNRISFKTQSLLTKKEAWDIFLAFLEISGFTVIAEASPKIKRIVTLDLAKKSPLPAYIGVSPSTLPSNDEMIRYVYFIENADLKTIDGVVNSLKSPGANLVMLNELKGFLITDKAYNIKSLMNIVKELDKLTMPQAMSVLKLRRADAREVEQLYKSLAGTSDKDIAQQRFFQGRKAPSSSYFPDNVGIFAEPRTNSLILLGPADSIKRIEDFITQSVDVELSQPYSPLHVLPIKYADAKVIAEIMNRATQWGANTEAGKSGGVRGGDKYMKPIFFTAEPETNRLIIKGDYEDFLKAKEVITQLDAPQPQVAIEVLLLAVSLNTNQQLGTQLRSRVPGTEGFFGNTKFQTSGLFGTGTVQTNPNGAGIDRLLGNLLNLVSSGIAAGNTIISLGDSLNVWAIVSALQTASNVQVLANPFLIATNKTKAVVSLGEVRRVTTGTIIGATTPVDTFGDAPAELKVEITPQINSDGMIILEIEVQLNQFVGEANPNNAVRTSRRIKTKTIVSNKEVLALGGLIQTNIDSVTTKVPILGDIPVVGWLFKNKQKTASKSNLLILISSRIIEPETDEAMIAFTNTHISDYTDTVDEMYETNQRRDPVSRWFFDGTNLNEAATDEFVYRKQRESEEKSKMPRDIVTPIAKNDSHNAVKNNEPLRMAQGPKRKNVSSQRRESNKEIRA